MTVFKIESDRGFSADRICVATTYFTRLKGLMFRRNLEVGEGLLLKNCGSIHCCFMYFPIDVVYLNDKMEVLKVETVRPWRVGSLVRGARHVLEVTEGAASTLGVGDKLIIKEAEVLHER